MKKFAAILCLAFLCLLIPPCVSGAAAAGAPPADEFVISTNQGPDAINGTPSIAFDGTNFLTVWLRGTDIYGARVSPDGAVLDPQRIPISVGLNAQTSEPRPPSVAFDGTNYLVVWVSTRGGVTEIYGCRVTPAGVALDPGGIQITAGGYPKVKPVGIVWNGTEYFIVWRTTLDVVMGIRVGANGSALSNPAGFQVIQRGFYPSVAFDPVHGVYLVASYVGTYTDLAINCTRVQADGTVLDNPAIVLSPAVGVRANPRVAFDGTNFMVIWADGRSDAAGHATGSLYGARVSPTGGMLGEPFVITYRVAQNTFPNIVFDGENYLAVWGTSLAFISDSEFWVCEKYRTSDTYAARISPAGTVLDPQPIPLCTAFAHQGGTSVAYGARRYLTVWNDLRGSFSSGTDALYARIFEKGMGNPQAPYMPHPQLPAGWAAQDIGIYLGAASGLATDSGNARLFCHSSAYVYKDGAWSIDRYDNGDNLGSKYACYATGATDIWAGGWAGYMDHNVNGTWAYVRPECGNTPVTGIWGNTLDDMWATLPKYDRFAHFSGGQWQTVPSAAYGDMQDIMGAGPDDIWAVGERGAVQHWDGSVWSLSPGIPTLQTLNAVWVNAPNDVFAVGDSGTILHYDGTRWTAQASPTTAHLKDLWGVDGSNMYAVGTCGMVLHYNGLGWSLEDAGTSNDLLTVFGGYGADGTCRLWAAGFGSSVYTKTISVAPPTTASPADFCVADGGIDSADLRWTLPDDRNVTGYRVEYREDGAADWTGVPLNRTDRYTVTGLDNSKVYSFRIRAQYRYAYLSAPTGEAGGRVLKMAVRFHSQGGTDVPVQAVNYGGHATRPPDPTRGDGQLFAGWFTDTSCVPDKEWNFDTQVMGNVDLYARWLPAKCTVKLDRLDGSVPVEILTDTGKAMAYPNNPEREGFAFGGWYTEAGCVNRWDFGTAVWHDMTLYAKWTVNTCTVTLNPQGGTVTPATKTVTFNAPYGALPMPNRAGHTFGGWYMDSACTGAAVTASTSVTATANHTLYAKWTVNTYTVSFSSQGGSAVPGVRAQYNTTIAAPAAPARAGYNLTGWYREATLKTAWDFAADRVTGNMTLYAGWAWAAPVPGKPQVTAASYNALRLAWPAVAGASGYEVWRSATSGGAYARIATVNTAGHTDPGLTPGATYWYKVRAFTDTGTQRKFSGFSPVASGRPVPLAPAVKAAAASYNSVRVTWGAVAGATKYELWRSASAAGTYRLLAATTARSYLNTSLATGASYWYRVRAYRLVGGKKVYGLWSAAQKAQPVLNAPAWLKAARASSTSVRLTWGAVAGRTRYEIWRCTSAGGKYALVGTTTSTGLTNTKLKTGQVYWFKVRAYHMEGTRKVYGGWSKVVSARP